MSEPVTPSPSKRMNRPPHFNIRNLHSGNGSAMGSMPPTAQIITGADQPYWPSYANPFATGGLMAKGFEGFVDFTKSGMSFGEKFTYSLYNKFSKWSKSWFTHMFLLTIVTLYTVGGAVLFGAIEGRKSKQEIIEIHTAQKQFFKAINNLAQDQELRRYSSAEFNGKLIYTLRAHQAAVESLLNNNKTLEEIQNVRHPWSFWNAMIYCGTIYTTIGYGHITPKTTLGQALTIIYAIIGIPMFLILLADFGKLFTRAIKFVWGYVRRLYYRGTCRKIRKQQHVRDAMTGFTVVYDMAIRRPSHFLGMSTEKDVESQAGKSNVETPTSPYPDTIIVDDEFNLPISLASLLLVSYILIGAFVYTLWEDWTYFEAFYFVFISMSTIGFGDLVPNHPIFMMCSILYMILGLALTSMFINVVQIKLSDTFRQASAKIGATIGLGLASEKGNDELSQSKTPSDLASVHATRLNKIPEMENEYSIPTETLSQTLTSMVTTSATATPSGPTLESITQTMPRISNVNVSAEVEEILSDNEDESTPPLLPKRQDANPTQSAPLTKKKKKHFF